MTIEERDKIKDILDEIIPVISGRNYRSKQRPESISMNDIAKDVKIRASIQSPEVILTKKNFKP